MSLPDTTRLLAPERDPFHYGQDLIRFETSEGRLRVWTLDEDNEQIRSTVDLSRDEMQSLGNDLLHSWQREIGFTKANTPLQNAVMQASSSAAKLHAALAAVGNFTMHELFSKIDEPMAQKLYDIVESHVTQSVSEQRPIIYMSDFAFPWRMLYASPKDVRERISEDAEPDDIDPRGFLGLAAMVDHMLPITKPPTRKPGSSVAVGVNVQFQARPGGEDDIRAALSARSDLELSFTSDEATFAKRIAEDNSALIYLFGHGRFRPATADSVMQEVLLNKKPLIGADLTRRIKTNISNEILSTSPVALVNACQGGVFRSDTTNDIVTALRNSGAAGTIGPMLDMPTCFGGAFGAELLKSLTKELSLTRALLDVTRHFMDEDRNPLGLAYSSINGKNSLLRRR
jgi:hypothetical protein